MKLVEKAGIQSFSDSIVWEDRGSSWVAVIQGENQHIRAIKTIACIPRQIEF